jgi:hypothetical protein
MSEEAFTPNGKVTPASSLARPIRMLCSAALALLCCAQAANAQPSQTPAKVTSGSAALVAHYDPIQKLRLSVVLTPPHWQEEQKFIEQLHDKKSPLFHKYLTAEQFAARFSPSVADEQVVAAWADSAGFTVTQRYPSRLIVDVEAPAGVIERALGVKINKYQLGAKSFYSNDRDPALPSHLSGIIQSVRGLNSFERPEPVKSHGVAVARPDYTPGPTVTVATAAHGAATAKLSEALKSDARSTTPQFLNGFYSPTDLYSSQAYDYQALYNQGHCCNPNGNAGGSPVESSIVIAAFGDLDYNDIAAYHNQFPYLAYNVQKVIVDGGYTCNNSSGPDLNCLETTLDTEFALSMANSFGSYLDTAKVWVYEGGGSDVSLFTRIMTDGNARVMSTSWGCSDGQCYSDAAMAADHTVFASMAAQGWTLIAASGDQGSTGACNDALAVVFPASDPYVVAAGGTELAIDPYTGNFVSEVAWTGGTAPGSCASNNGGGTGGLSSYFPAPSYQAGLGVGNRATPDISLNAYYGQAMIYGGNLYYPGGTSIVGPELAGFFAQENAYLLSIGNACGPSGSSACAPLGAANPYLYGSLLQTAPHYPFYDVTSGCNSNDITLAYGLGFYCAQSGYDLATGWGSANMLQLAWGLNWAVAATGAAPTVTFGGPATNVWYNTDQVIDWSVNDVATPGFNPTGIAGFTQGWDVIPTDSRREATPGSGDSFYAGPQHINASFGCTDLSGALCSGGVSQGCHTMHVRGWNNMGVSSGDNTYGPVCYDTVAPATTLILSGTKTGAVYSTPVKSTLSAADASSGVASTLYSVDGAAAVKYTGPFAVSAVGAHTVSYHSIDVAGNVEPSHSAAFTIESPTATKLTSSLNPTVYGQSVTFTATVSPSFGAVATGTVTLKVGTGTLGTATLSGGTATFTTKTLPAGADAITAVYGGSASDLTSTSAALTQTVKKATTTTALASSLNPATHGKSVTFTATIKPQYAGAVTGTVTFKDGTKTLGTGAVNAMTDKATFTTSTLTVGTHAITAAFGGNSNNVASTSSSLHEVIK